MPRQEDLFPARKVTNVFMDLEDKAGQRCSATLQEDDATRRRVLP
jgi:hypothetical protein